MKKVYTKPQIVFENFSLSQNIATTCEVESDSEELYMTGLGYAFTTEAGCDYPVPGQVGGDGIYNGICYHVFSEEAWGNVFGS